MHSRDLMRQQTLRGLGMVGTEVKKQVIYEFLSFLETRGIRVSRLVPEKKGLFNVTQAGSVTS